MSLLRRLPTAALVALVPAGLVPPEPRAIAIEWMTVGDPGNAADTNPSGYGAVADTFQIMKYEFTNSQYTAFLNSVAATDTYSLYSADMGSNPRGGITQSGSSGSYTYSVRANMGDKPVNFVSWFDAARAANWLANGGSSWSSTETGAYTLVDGQTSGTAPARNPGATFYIPTENQWYKAAYYKGGSTNAGYWDYATQSDAVPTAVTAGSGGVGSAGGTGNFANYDRAADWNGQNGNVTTVGTNGGPSAYGAFDMSGNALEWHDINGSAGSDRGLRGGVWDNSAFYLSSSFSDSIGSHANYDSLGFRLVSLFPAPLPSVTINVASGTVTQAQAGYATLDGISPVNKFGDGTLLLTAANALTGAFYVHGGYVQIANSVALAASPVYVQPIGVLTLSPGLHANLGGLSPNAGGLIDVGTGKITVRSGLSASALTTAILAGQASGTSGIISSDAALLPNLRTVGWLDNGDGSVTFGYAAPGDGTLDGTVDIMDIAYFLASGKYGTLRPATWRDGDFNYDGMLDDLDIAGFLSTGLFNNGYYNTPAGNIAAVPEPATFGMAIVALACGGYSMRQRRKRV